MPSLGTLRVRIGAAVVALAVGVALAAYPLVGVGSLFRVTLPLAAIGVLLLLLALAWPLRLTGPALFVLVGEYLAVEVTGRVPTVSVVAYAIGLVVLSEVLHFLGQLPASGGVDLRVITERLLHLGLISLGAAVIAVLVLVVGGLRTFDALAAGLVGLTAALLLCLIPWVLIQRAGSR